MTTIGPYELDSVTCADALAFLAALPDGCADAVVTDPPYGLAGRVFDFPHKHYTAINEEWDHTAPIHWMAQCNRVLKPGGSVLCFGVRQSIYTFAAEGLRLGWRLVNDITWIKPDAPPSFTGRLLTETTERLLWFCPSGSGWTYDLAQAKRIGRGINLRDVWTFPIERDKRMHPAQKPVGLLQRAISLVTQPGALVIDPFAGSGTTGVAARSLGRHFLLCDITPEYVRIAQDRLAAPYTPPLFVDDAPAPRGEQLSMLGDD